MAKLMSMFLVLIAIQVGLILYAGQDAAQTDIWTFIMNMGQWGTLDFVLAILGLTGIGLIGVTAASAFGFKSDFIVLAVAIPGLISIGLVFSNLAKYLSAELIAIFDPTCALPCLPINFIVGLIVGPIALYYVWTVIDWWRGKDF